MNLVIGVGQGSERRADYGGAMLKRGLLLGAALVAMASPAVAQREVTLGTVLDAKLDRGDSHLNSGEYIENYELRGQAGDVVTIRAESSDFDPYLLVRGVGGFSQDNDDVSSTDRSAELSSACRPMAAIALV